MGELKRLEIDIPNKKFEVNGEELKNCTELKVTFENGKWNVKIVNEFEQRNS